MTMALFTGYAVVFVMMCLVWALSVRLRNAAVVDVAWGAGFFLFAGIGAALSDGADARKYLLAAMIMLWSGRLALHLLKERVLAPGPEDERYQEIRARWKTRLDLKFFLFFQLQALFIAGLSVPFGLRRSPARRPPTASSRASRAIRRTRGRSAGRACGAIRVIRTISLNGAFGSPISSSLSQAPSGGPPPRDRSSCTSFSPA
jgi:steroid 5-alpha reductase family enzyme